MSAKELLIRALHSKFFMIGFIMALFMVVAVIVGPMLIPYDANKMDVINNLQAPELHGENGDFPHLLGTDGLGRDLLVRLLVGGRVSFKIAFFAVMFGGFLGTILGLVSGFFGKIVDTVIMRVGDIQLSINTTLLAIVVASILGPSVTNLIIVMVIASWTKFARLIRGEMLFVKTKEFISASRVLGGSNSHIIFRQALPNVTTSLIVLLSQQFGQIILLEAALSFLGMGVPVPNPSWGTMISDGRAYLEIAPWIVVVPGIALMLSVLAFNFLGDGIRDVLDPKMKHS